ncbi:class GN sortase [Sphingobium aromaticiconvertens]|uniref:class GN sortase n=1 Tax=Sphingobium aromaticiconvertens TaxID=365341 RepID=UPI00301947B7
MTIALHMRAASKGGRVFGRVLRRMMLVGLCAIGILLVARGAMIPAKAWVAQILLDRAFERSVASHKPVRPWPWADTAPVARIRVPRLGISEIILSGGSGQAMAFGPTLLPLQQESGHAPISIMAGHRDTHFTFLKDLKIGDMVDVEEVSGQHRRFRITRSQIVRWDRFGYPRYSISPHLALATCYPFDAVERGPLRFVLWAEELNWSQRYGT